MNFNVADLCIGNEWVSHHGEVKRFAGRLVVCWRRGGRRESPMAAGRLLKMPDNQRID